MKADWDVSSKVHEVMHELKRIGLYKQDTPQWVLQFRQESIIGEQEFAEWLQFIYLPNCLQHTAARKNNIAIQAVKFLGKDPSRERLLQLLIELDAL